MITTVYCYYQKSFKKLHFLHKEILAQLVTGEVEILATTLASEDVLDDHCDHADVDDDHDHGHKGC